ncbi:CapA family protein [Odoribacter sp. OttesenSCG-928-A06]|nr:CapA family protein [Odoribacter sp. OttesenSCG-928-A06]
MSVGSMINILIAGDYSPVYRVQKVIEEGQVNFLFDNIKPIIASADYSIVNFESSLPLNGEKEIPKNGPNLKTTPIAMEGLKCVGFDCVTLANNHILDYGAGGLRGAIETCNKLGIDSVGAGGNLEEAQRILYKELKGKLIAIINVCENEFSIATKEQPGAAPLDLADNYKQILAAKLKADYVIVIVHGGHEHYQLPSPRMKKIYRYFIDIGANVIVNHHQHCYSGYEIYNKGLIFYGLGNFCFDSLNFRDRKWNEGYMLKIELGDSISFRCYPYTQCTNDVSIILFDKERYLEFNKSIEEINTIIKNDAALERAFEDFVDNQKKSYNYMIEPYDSRYLRFLFYRNILPSCWSKKKIGGLFNYISTESHRDILLKVLYDRMK